MDKDIKRVTELLERKFRESWHKEPEDVKRLRIGQVQGAYRQIGGPILYAESETREYGRLFMVTKRFSKRR